MGRLLILLSLLFLTLAGCATEPEPTVRPTEVPPATAVPPIGVDFATRAAPTAVIVQVTPTPPPTPTITPTATPVVYTVVEGDTLLGIALASGTTVEAIEALNPGIQPGLLQIGQGIILPPPPTPQPFAGGGTAVPVQLRVVDVQSHPMAAGGVLVLGEIINDGAEPVENVRLQVDLLDEANQPTAEGQTWLAKPVIPPGGRAPFVLRFPQVAPQGTQPRVAIIDGQTMVEAGNRALDLVVEDDFIMEEYEEGLLIRGRVVNEGETAVINTLIVATFYNSQERIVGFQQLQLDSALEPGAAAQFTLAAVPPGGRAVVVDFAAFGLKVTD